MLKIWVCYWINNNNRPSKMSKWVPSIEVMWLSIVTCASRYNHILHYRVKKSYRYIKWKLLKGRYANDFYVQIWALNLYIWCNQGLCSVITQFCFIKLICLQFTCTFGGTSCHLTFLNLQAWISQNVTLLQTACMRQV